MKKAVVVFLLVLFSGVVSAENLPLTIWQKETRSQPKDGQTINLNRGPFTLVLPLGSGEHVDVLAAEGDVPDELTAFDPGHGMAGPYDGLFLSWDAFHYFHIYDDAPRAELWDRDKKQYFWKAGKVYRNYGLGPAREVPWDELEDLTVMVRKDGFDDLTFRINWVDY